MYIYIYILKGKHNSKGEQNTRREKNNKVEEEKKRKQKKNKNSTTPHEIKSSETFKNKQEETFFENTSWYTRVDVGRKIRGR